MPAIVPASLESLAPEEDEGRRVTARIAGQVADLAARLEREASPEVVAAFLIDRLSAMFTGGAPETSGSGPGSGVARELAALEEALRGAWRRVSPFVLGTLLERALSPAERRRLGAHYTPEAPIRRLVARTITGPLREEWTRVRGEIDVLRREGDEAAARAHGRRFWRRLASVRVLDPACGTGNFLYVALRELRRLEDEVERALALEPEPGFLRPVQFLGLEIKPSAARIAGLVLEIGERQARGSAPLAGLHSIRVADALITWERTESLVDEDGAPVLRAAGVTSKRAERRLVAVERHVGVARADWPEADFIVGNPPFLGNKRMRDVLGAGYVEAIRSAYAGAGLAGADLVMGWWWRCADLVARGELRAFGLVTTNSITQSACRAVVAGAIARGVRLVYAVPDHPWYDEGAAVRIAMTVGTAEPRTPVLGRVIDESRTRAAELDAVRVVEEPVDELDAHLRSGAALGRVTPLRSNAGLAFMGMTLLGDGFRLDEEELRALRLRPGRLPAVVRPYLTGRDVSQGGAPRWVIDLFGLSEAEARAAHPALLDHLARTVRPIRERQNEAAPRERWWLFGRPRPDLRAALSGLRRYIATLETSKHRFFVFVPAGVVPDHSLFAVASDDAFVLGVLSSRVHRVWCTAMGGTLEDRPRWRSQTCFDPFPFPAADAAARARIAELGEAVDAHRARQARAAPGLALTDVYNALEKLRSGVSLAPPEEELRGRVMIDALLALHDALDAAVLGAYRLSPSLSDAEVLARLVALNAERAREEQGGRTIRYLRPELQRGAQAPSGAPKGAAAPSRRSVKRDGDTWPSDVLERVVRVVRALREHEAPATAEALASRLKGAGTEEVALVLRHAAAAQLVAPIVTSEGEVWIARGAVTG